MENPAGVVIRRYGLRAYGEETPFPLGRGGRVPPALWWEDPICFGPGGKKDGLFQAYRKERGAEWGDVHRDLFRTSLQALLPLQVSPSLLPGKVSIWVEKIEVQVVQISLTQQTSSGLVSSHQGELGATISFH